MPTTISSAGRTASAELQKLLVYLGVVVAFIFTAFGIAKMIDVLRTRRRTESTMAQGLLGEAPPGRYGLPSTPQCPSVVLNIHSAPAFFNPGNVPGLISFSRKARPQNALTGAIQYTKSSPHLYHITSPRAYALHHRRRPHFIRPGPSLLRHVIIITARGHTSHSTMHGVQRSTTRALAKLYGNHDSPFRRRLDPWCAVEALQRTADDLVGAHPNAILHSERVATQQEVFPWVASSGVSGNFRFGLVRGNAAARRSLIKPYVQADTLPGRPLNNFNNANPAGRKTLVDGPKAKVGRRAVMMRFHESGKENIVPV
ncbi:hypothetical protein B0H16DRAFT_1687770 [Mycena metata]|uniref:Uncharacterized protein n=1 Tax=Mycena metata TaxID=1033252 RepID=A0AAD7JGM7_9AGAR|nr:hypothetical protein B0H16DRAFT_1687770 [Mycena metata]